MKKFLAILAVLALLLAVPYYWAGRGELPMDDHARQQAPGQMAKLDDGMIHYLWNGPEDGPVVVLVHGFSTPSFVFEQNARGLAESGFRVLRFDHFGRGWSDRPEGPYDTDFYDRELIQLLDQLGVDQKIHLTGYSMGGIISAEFAARHPERIASLFLIAPAGLTVEGGDDLSTRLVAMPVIGDWIWRVVGRSVLLGDPQYDEAGLPAANRLKGDVSRQLDYAGYFPALLSTLRHLPMRDRDDSFRRLAQTGLPVHAVFGGKDTTISPKNADVLKKLVPAAEVHLIADGDHGLAYKRHEAVNPLLIAAFEKPEPAAVP